METIWRDNYRVYRSTRLDDMIEYLIDLLQTSRVNHLSLSHDGNRINVNANHCDNVTRKPLLRTLESLWPLARNSTCVESLLKQIY